MNCILSRAFLTEEPIYNMTLETNTGFPMCMLFLLGTAVTDYLPNKLLVETLNRFF